MAFNTRLTGANKEEKAVTVEKGAAVEKAEKPVKKQENKPKRPQIARVIPDLCNIRKKPDANAPIVKTVSKNAEFKVDSQHSTDGYVAVSIEGDTAFIRKDLVTVFDNPAYAAGELAMKIGGK